MSSDEAVTTEGEAEEAPSDPLREGLLAELTELLGDALVGSHIRAGDDLWIRVGRDQWAEAGHAVRDRLGCQYFTFLSAIDWMPSPYGLEEDSEIDHSVGNTSPRTPADVATGYAGGDTRFQVFARVANLDQRYGLTLKCDIPDDDMSCPTWVRVYTGAEWHEREAHEMYGIDFVGHPDLRHIYLPTEFEGHPLRKDFPLLARRVKPWPGIVDVEGMPGEGAEPGEGEPGEEAEPAEGAEGTAETAGDPA